MTRSAECLAQRSVVPGAERHAIPTMRHRDIASIPIILQNAAHAVALGVLTVCAVQIVTARAK